MTTNKTSPLARERTDLVPANAWDTHHHIFELDKYPLSEERHFTPSNASLEQLVAFQRGLGFERICIAHGLSFGYDLTSLKVYLRYFEGAAIGIGVIDHETITDAELQELHALGVRSIRADFFRYRSMESFEKATAFIQAVTARVAPMRWPVHVQFSNASWWDKLVDTVLASPVPIVVDHLAFLKGASWKSEDMFDALTQPGMTGITTLLKSGKLWIKLSAPYRNSHLAPHFSDLEPVVRALTAANPHRILYGSDWPHTQPWENRKSGSRLEPEPFLPVDDEAWLKSLKSWLNEDEWQNMLVKNPEILFDSRS